MATILFQTSLRRTLGLSRIEVEQGDAVTLDMLLSTCQKMIAKPLRQLLLDKNGQLSHGMILLNGRNVLLLQGLQTLVGNDDELNIFPPAGGG